MGFCVARISGDLQDPSADSRLDGSEEQLNDPDRIEKEVSQMPRGDGTGPAGMGPMTGRAAGYCAGYPAPGFMNPAVGMGVGVRAPYLAQGPAYAPAYGVGVPYRRAMGFPFARGFFGGFGFGRGFGRGRGRGFGMGRWGW